MKVRTFELVNEKGEVFSLMDIKEGCIFKEPSNLGYGYTSEFQRVGNTYIETLRTLNQSTIPGKMEFKNYDNYRKFIDFIEASESLKWKCIIPYSSGSKTYFKDIVFEEIEKNDLFTEDDKLITTVNFNCLSLWYEENTFVHDMKQQKGVISWNFRWNSRFADFSTRSLKYINNGHVEAPILVEIEGPVVNPRIQLYVEGQFYQELPFIVSLEKYEKLLYGTKEGEFHLNRQKSDGTLENLFSLKVLDPQNNEVIRLPKNKSCELKLVADNDILNAKVTIFAYYKAI